MIQKPLPFQEPLFEDRTLLIVDMQFQFRAARDENTMKACCREIKKAISRGYGICLVEYISCGPTLYQIKEAIGDYKRVAIHKKNNNGDPCIDDTLRQYKFNTERIIVCGVNTGACVKACMYQLVKHRGYEWSNFTVVADAVNSEGFGEGAAHGITLLHLHQFLQNGVKIEQIEIVEQYNNCGSAI